MINGIKEKLYPYKFVDKEFDNQISYKFSISKYDKLANGWTALIESMDKIILRYYITNISSILSTQILSSFNLAEEQFLISESSDFFQNIDLKNYNKLIDIIDESKMMISSSFICDEIVMWTKIDHSNMIDNMLYPNGIFGDIDSNDVSLNKMLRIKNCDVYYSHESIMSKKINICDDISYNIKCNYNENEFLVWFSFKIENPKTITIVKDKNSEEYSRYIISERNKKINEIWKTQ